MVFKHEKYADQVIGNGTDNKKHIAESQTGWRKKKRGGKGGMNWDGTVPNFQVTHPHHPLFLLNTEKFTFFPHKSA